MAMRYTGTINLYAGFPAIPKNTPVATDGDRYPSSRAIRRSHSYDGVATYNYTWKFQDSYNCWNRVVGIVYAGFICSPATVTWGSVTKTYRRPANPNGGIPRWTKNIGTATLYDGVTLLDSATVYEDRQPLMSAPNTFTECRKLPPEPFANSPSTFLSVYDSVSPNLTIGADYNSCSFAAKRYLGPDGVAYTITGSVSTGGGGYTVDIWVVPIDPGTLTADVSAAVNVASVTETGGINTPYFISSTTLEAAGVVRWDQYWIYATSAGPIAGDWEIQVILSSPLDIPPPYDCPGLTTVIPGGFYT